MSSWFNKILAVDPNQNVNWGGGVKRVNGNPFTPTGGVDGGGGVQPSYQNYELSPKYLDTATEGQIFTNGVGHADFKKLNLMA